MAHSTTRPTSAVPTSALPRSLDRTPGRIRRTGPHFQEGRTRSGVTLGSCSTWSSGGSLPVRCHRDVVDLSKPGTGGYQPVRFILRLG